jgi:hypothetical protein
MSFAQMSKQDKCWCCGKGHKLPDCPQKHSIPKDQWFVNNAKDMKKYQNLVAEMNNVMNDDIKASKATSSAAATVVTQGTEDQADRASWAFYQFCGVQHEPFLDQLALDSCSSIDLIGRADWLQNVQPAASTEQLHTNAGVISVQQEGTLPQFGKVPHHPEAVANIMSLALMTDKYRVTFDSAKDNAFVVHLPDRTVRFARNQNNLYTHS